MRYLKSKLYQVAEFFRSGLTVASLWFPAWPWKKTPTEIPVVVSMTSYPPRIRSAWIAIESLLRQSVRPQKLFLVLNTDEFPDKILPSKIRTQTKKGLEILWVDRNGGSYDKLIPVRKRYPDQPVVTFDDDKIFPRKVLENLYRTSVQNPGAVIGTRGWAIRMDGDGFRYGVKWERISSPQKGKCLFTPGGNGCLYPPDSLDDGVQNISAALEICPTADDIWFWCSLQKAGASLVCLGMPAHRPVRAMRFSRALSDTNREQNDPQLQRAVDYWKIRTLVLTNLRTIESSHE